MIAPPTSRPAAEEFALTSGLLRLLVLDRVPIERLAERYGFSPTGLRSRMLDHLGACLVAIELPEQETAQAVPAAAEAASLAPPVRIRERVRPAPSSAPDPTYSNRIRAVRMR